MRRQVPSQSRLPFYSSLAANMFRSRNSEEEKVTIESIEERREVRVDMEENISDAWCIYRVPKSIHEVNAEAYTPKMISVGPLHYKKEELAAMEKQKVRYKKDFNNRARGNGTSSRGNNDELWQQIVALIEQQEQSIRNCYEEKFPGLDKHEFIEMILYDSVFVIEFLLMTYDGKRDVLLDKINVYSGIWLDMQLLENQLPYFFLKKLYDLAFSSSRPTSDGYPPFFTLCYFFINNGDLRGVRPGDPVEVKHFTDIRRYVMTCDYHHVSQSTPILADLPCAAKLRRSGVKFMVKQAQKPFSLDISFQKKKSLLPCFEVNELQIPPIKLIEQTEVLVRNVMAYEQCVYGPSAQPYVSTYFKFMDSLVDTEDDVDLLVEAGVLSNSLGDNGRAVKLFNTLCQQIFTEGSNYNDMVKTLKAHYDNPQSHTNATLNRVYFSNLWRGTATVAAVVLLLLTLMQTICSVISVVCTFHKCN